MTFCIIINKPESPALTALQAMTVDALGRDGCVRWVQETVSEALAEALLAGPLYRDEDCARRIAEAVEKRVGRLFP